MQWTFDLCESFFYMDWTRAGHFKSPPYLAQCCIGVNQSWGLRPQSYDKTGLTPAFVLVLVLYFWFWSWSYTFVSNTNNNNNNTTICKAP